MLYITTKGEAYLETLKMKEKTFGSEINAFSVPEDKVARRRLTQRANSRWRRFGPALHVLWDLSQSPQPREHFCWHEDLQGRNKPLQAGYVRVHDKAKDTVINELITHGFVEQRLEKSPYTK
jgi:hypothetical protein